ncbi:hypothetical protein BaRGS_00016550 [Batillaria attramentaria]|uniref:NADH dehydrogenase (ubiquinone) complex I, assembly factor 6 n=1 Tax=Batillaria attramentaria TaxID=370345 RepID=A0ABD0KYK5_9CAEN
MNSKPIPISSKYPHNSLVSIPKWPTPFAKRPKATTITLNINMRLLVGCRQVPVVLLRSCWGASAGTIVHRDSRCREFSSQQLDNPSYCTDLVKKYDHENYLCCLLLPKDLQRAAFAIRAFNVELAQVRDVVSEKKIGAMRLQFWKDTVERLLEAARYFRLSKRLFKRLVEARAEQLERDGFQSIQEVELYAENTASTLHYLMLECLGVKNVHADHAASHIGKAQGVTTLLRAIPYHAQSRRVYLPLEIIVKHKVSQEDIMRGKAEKNIRDAVFEVATIAHRHLETARSFQKDVPKKAFVAFLNTYPTDHYLKRLQAANFNVFDPKLQIRNSTLPLYLWLQKRRKKY